MRVKEKEPVEDEGASCEDEGPPDDYYDEGHKKDLPYCHDGHSDSSDERYY